MSRIVSVVLISGSRALLEKPLFALLVFFSNRDIAVGLERLWAGRKGFQYHSRFRETVGWT